MFEFLVLFTARNNLEKRGTEKLEFDFLFDCRGAAHQLFINTNSDFASLVVSASKYENEL